MKAKKILLLLGHPDAKSFNAALLEAYQKGAENAGAEVRQVELGALDFNPNLQHGYHQRMDLEPDLLAAWEDVQWAEHIVFFAPVWWGSIPAVAKGFFDRLFLPGMAFQKRENSLWWDKLLKGKTGRLVFTLDQPTWYYRLFNGRPTYHSMKKMVFGFVGIKVKGVSNFGPLRGSNPNRRSKWLRKMESLGARIA